MRLTFTFAARVTEWNSGEEIDAPHWLDRWRASEDRLENYFDDTLADAGVTGGEVWIFTKRGKAKIQVIYWISNEVSNEIVELLRSYTIGQMDDGMGEGGFECALNDERLAVIADTESAIEVELIDDGQIIRGPSRIAIAARDGNLASLTAAITADGSEIDRRLKGYTGLHLSILYGHLQAALALLAAGADPNQLAPMESTPLQHCALSNLLDDAESLILAKALVESGAAIGRIGSSGESAESYAASRGKVLTSDFLKHCSGE